MSAYYLIISGKVQGVFYRASAKKAADELGVKGWVKNMRDGRVEAFAQGTEEQVQQFINWCRKGPKGASVTSVEVTDADDRDFEDFKIEK